MRKGWSGRREAQASSAATGSRVPGWQAAGLRFLPYFLSASCFHLFQAFQGGAGGALLGFLLGAALRGGQTLAAGPHFNSKRLLVVRAAFSCDPVLRGWPAAALQEFFQRGFIVAVSNAVPPFHR